MLLHYNGSIAITCGGDSSECELTAADRVMRCHSHPKSLVLYEEFVVSSGVTSSGGQLIGGAFPSIGDRRHKVEDDN